MREILFRGKKNNSNDWVYGNLFNPDKADTPTQICMGTHIVRICYEIDPETVGQYTGLTDKNGRKIFEGDIINYKGALANIIYSTEKAGFYAIFSSWYTDFSALSAGKYVSVIGNIYDNPELLEVKQNG